MKCTRDGCNRPARHTREFLHDGEVSVEHLCDFHKEEAEIIAMLQESLDDSVYEKIRTKIRQRSICDCGITEARFREERIAGCAKCYDRFAETAQELITEIHGVDRYAGPDRIDSRKYRIAMLRERINQAVEREEFREAARLRQELTALERQDHEEA